MRFVKMHGCGNDYIIVNGITEKIDNPCELAVRISNRNYGVGSDGLIIIYQSRRADFRMKMYNLDGTEGKMCGNGIRCVGKYIYDKKLTRKEKIRIETDSGIHVVMINENSICRGRVSVDMGTPSFASRMIPIKTDLRMIMNEHLTVEDTIYNISCVSMGNPHAVIFTDDIVNINDNGTVTRLDILAKDIDIDKLGCEIQKNSWFPNGTNVEIVDIIDEENINVRVYERGSGTTLACGTGACAAVAAGYQTNRCNSKVNVNMPGGNLFVQFSNSGRKIILTGEAVLVYEGNYYDIR